MGKHDINVDDVKIMVHVIDCAAGVDKYIAEMRSRLEFGSKIIGIDHKKLKPHSGYNANSILVLYAPLQCLIIHLDRVGVRGESGDAPASLDNFLSDPTICFVGVQLPSNPATYVKFQHRNTAVKVGELAARVLKKPELTSSTLSDVAREVGLLYKGAASATAEIEVDSKNSVVFTEDHVKAAISDARAYCQIGFKLLISL